MEENKPNKIQSYLEVKLLVEEAAKKGITLSFMPVEEGDFWTTLEKKDASGYGFDTMKAFVKGLTYMDE